MIVVRPTRSRAVAPLAVIPFWVAPFITESRIIIDALLDGTLTKMPLAPPLISELNTSTVIPDPVLPVVSILS